MKDQELKDKLQELSDQFRAESRDFRLIARETCLRHWIEPYLTMSRLCADHAIRVNTLLKDLGA